MRELLYEIKQLTEGRMLNLHRHMLRVKYDAVLIIIYIRRILESPRSIIDCDRNNPVILPCRMINTSRISFIFRAKKTFRIASGFYIPCRGNCFWIFFRFGQIDGNINLTVWTVYLPLLILLYAISADIIAVLTQFIKIIGCFLWAFFIFIPELFLHLARTRHQTAH